MKTGDKKFISDIVSSDFKQISNPDFAVDTLERIAELEANRISYSTSGDITFLIPQVIYASLLILLSLITVFISWARPEQINNVANSIEMITGYLLHPVTVSSLFAFTLLFLIDRFLEKANRLSTKPNIGL